MHNFGRLSVGKKLVVVVGLLVLLVGGFVLLKNVPATGQHQETNEEAMVRERVVAFGDELRMVSLLAPTQEASAEIQKYYSAHITPELLAAWRAKPQDAPGRYTSSPWPDRIDITSIQKTSDTAYVVEGTVIEITRTGESEAASYPIVATVELYGDVWLIAGLQVLAPPSRE